MIPAAEPIGLVAATLVIVAVAAGYFHAVQMPRPPVGRLMASDVVIMTALLIALPFIYVHLPGVLLEVIFGLVFFSAVQTTLAPRLRGQPAVLAAFVLCAVVLAAGLTHHPLLLEVTNDLLLGISVVGVVNLWAQTGMTAAQVAALSAVLAVYDLAATGLTSLTATFLHRVGGKAFAPALSIGLGHSQVALGLGDCLLLTLWPLVAAKTYGRAAGIVAAGLALATVAAVEAAVAAGAITGNVPMLSFLGPVAIVQWALWRWHRSRERTTGEWRAGAGLAPVTGTPIPPSPYEPALGTVAAMAADDVAANNGHWVAVHHGVTVGRGPTPGRARRAAREAGCPDVPVVLRVSADMTGLVIGEAQVH
ncbi:MAG TPA: hypothetical protein VGH27_00250 [Streptosporangiaceae bacterium]|jgi:hypothetical protein